MKYKIDLVGQKYGKLTVLSYAGRKQSGKNQKKTMWLCRCECGNEKVIAGRELRNGHTTSCGCTHKKMVGALNRKHGLSANCGRLYPLWKSIKYRCNNPKNKSYKNYGGRGIKVCEEWQNDFKAFYDWAIEAGYKEEKTEKGLNILTIDRIDNDGDYCPENCRWITNAEQSRNKRNSLSDEERYAVCPVCGKTYKKTQRKGSKTCSRECGYKLRYMKNNNGL